MRYIFGKYGLETRFQYTRLAGRTPAGRTQGSQHRTVLSTGHQKKCKYAACGSELFKKRTDRLLALSQQYWNDLLCVTSKKKCRDNVPPCCSHLLGSYNNESCLHSFFGRVSWLAPQLVEYRSVYNVRKVRGSNPLPWYHYSESYIIEDKVLPL